MSTKQSWWGLRLLFSLLFVLSAGLSGGQAQGLAPEGDLPGLGLVRERAPELEAAAWPGRTAPQAAEGPQAARLPGSPVGFDSYRDGSYEIYSASDDGSALLRLTNDAGTDIQARFNRGLTKIAFASNRVGEFEIYAMNPDGSGLAKLTATSKDEYYPAWSPDGTRIVYQRNDGTSNTPNFEIYIMNANGSSQVRLTDDAGYDGMPTWSPNGSKIAWTAYRGGAYRIWAMNANGSGPVQLSGQPYSEGAAYSPDGSQIAYDADSNGDGWQEVWVMNADGSNQHVVYTPGAYQDAYVSGWSPDGNWITYNHVYFIYQNSAWYWTDSFLMMVSPTAQPVVETALLGGNTDWRPDWQTSDALTPVSSMASLPAVSPGPFQVSWNGSDSGGSGLKSYDIQVKDGVAGAWTDLLPGTTLTSAVYPGIGGHSYYFRSRARDNSCNLEAWPADYDTFTTVEALAPQSTITSLPVYSQARFFVSWVGADSGGSGIRAYDVQYKNLTDSGAWTNWQMGVPNTFASFDGPPGKKYAFRVKAVDWAQNMEAWPAADSGDASTTVVSFAAMGKVMDIEGNPVVGAGVLTSEAPYLSHASQSDGSYDVFGATDPYTLTLNWSKTGYGSLPDTTYNVPMLTQTDAVLPPVDNLLNDPGFESGAFEAAAWTAGGDMPPQFSSNPLHTGQKSLRLGLASEGYSNPTTINSGFPEAAKMAVGQDGVVHLAWKVTRNAEPGIFYTRREANGQWSAVIEKISGNDQGGDVELAVDAGGAVNVAWTNAGNVYFARRPSGGWWSVPLDFGSVGGPFKIAAQPDGVVHLIWIAAGSPQPMLHARRDLSGAWSTAQVINYPVIHYGNYNLAVQLAASGELHVMFFSNGGYSLEYSHLPASGAWTTEKIGADAGAFMATPSMVVDGGGKAHFVWGIYNAMKAAIMYCARDAGGNWKVEVVTSSGHDLSPEMAVGPGGIVHVTWMFKYYDHSKDVQFYTNRGLNGSWSAPLRMPFGVHMAVDGQETLHVAGANGSWYGSQVMYAERTADGKWTDWYDRALGVIPGDPMIALDGNRQAHLLWPSPWYPNELYYSGPPDPGLSGVSSVSQAVSIPNAMAKPTLSFLYKISSEAGVPPGSFAVKVQDGLATDTIFSTSTSTSGGWIHASLDLSAYRGKQITLWMSLTQAPGWPYPAVYLDEVVIGTVSPDVWVGQGRSVAGQPGGTVVLPVLYGNQGYAPANAGVLTVTLPDKLSFVSADVPPSSVNGQVLTWNVGTLAGRSGPASLQITVTVAADAPLLSTLDTGLDIQTTSNELEKANNTILLKAFVGSRMYIGAVYKSD